MRKELTVFINTFEKGEEISVTSLRIDRKYIVLNGASGRFTANVDELLDAINELKAFNVDDNVGNIQFDEIVFGEE
jgi:hypothetical protein